MSGKFHNVIGIDLGTTYSAVSVYNNDTMETEIVIDKSRDAGDRGETTPSVISLDPVTNHVIVGWAAKRNISNRPLDTIIEIKREMGENFTPELLKKFNAEGKHQTDSPIRVLFNGEWMLPQALSAFTLMKMKDVAEAELKTPIQDAVITVPAYFTEKQKKATEEAALLAGLHPRQLIPEPTAAAICYGVDKSEDEEKTYLVYDLGGGTFDVSIIKVEGEKISVLSTAGNARLGGGDFDDAIVAWVVQELKAQGIDVGGDATILAKIKERAEQSKIMVSMHPQVNIDLLFLNSPVIQNLSLTREKFEELIDPLLQDSLTAVNAAINKAEGKASRDSIDAILLVGGSSKIPKVKEILLDSFGKDESFVRSEINPDTVVARGAAMMAQQFVASPAPFDIKKKPDATLKNLDADDDIELSLITEHSLGIGVQNNRMVTIVKQGSNLPNEVKKGGFTNGGPVPLIPVQVFQGEGEYTYENTMIGTLQIGPMEPKPANFHQFEVVFKLDENGLLTMTIIHLNENKEYNAEFEQKTGVGGDDALIVLRNKLVEMFASPGATIPQGDDQGISPSTSVGTVPVPARTPIQPVPAPQSAHAVPVPGGEIPIPQRAPAPQSPKSVPVPPAETPQPVPAPQSPQAPPATVVAPQPVPTQGAVPTSNNQGLLEPTAEVPADFRSILRRAKKQLQKGHEQGLFDAINLFVSKLNSGAPSDEVEEAGDDLGDAYSDAVAAMEKAAKDPLETTREIPAEFSSIFRRAKKQLQKAQNQELFESLKNFVDKLNTSAPESEIEQAGDDLGDAYEDARRN